MATIWYSKYLRYWVITLFASSSTANGDELRSARVRLRTGYSQDHAADVDLQAVLLVVKEEERQLKLAERFDWIQDYPSGDAGKTSVGMVGVDIVALDASEPVKRVSVDEGDDHGTLVSVNQDSAAVSPGDPEQPDCEKRDKESSCQ
ncbi:hypothetical protein FRC01_009510 [Tulasnella sp. 417]|nr:hypothetical protein FRC01_009510 [Tulasnella sp. 417]